MQTTDVALLRIDRLLDTYDFNDLLEENDLTIEDVVELLINLNYIKFIKPVDYE